MHNAKKNYKKMILVHVKNYMNENVTIFVCIKLKTSLTDEKSRIKKKKLTLIEVKAKTIQRERIRNIISMRKVCYK